MCYFYFSFQDNKRNSLGALLRSLISQILRFEQQVPGPVLQLYTECHQQFPARQPDDDALQETFLGLLSGEDAEKDNLSGSGDERLFIVIDAIDEIPFEQRSEVLEFLNGLTTHSPDKLHVLVTSRNEPDIDAVLHSADSRWRSFAIPTEAVDKDIELFITRRLKAHARLARLLKDKQWLTELIHAKLVNQAEGWCVSHEATVYIR